MDSKAEINYTTLVAELERYAEERYHVKVKLSVKTETADDWEELLPVVAASLGISSYHFESNVRNERIVFMRQITARIIRELFNVPISFIAERFGKHHTTIISNIKTCDNLLHTGHPLMVEMYGKASAAARAWFLKKYENG